MSMSSRASPSGMPRHSTTSSPPPPPLPPLLPLLPNPFIGEDEPRSAVVRVAERRQGAVQVPDEWPPPAQRACSDSMSVSIVTKKNGKKWKRLAAAINEIASQGSIAI